MQFRVSRFATDENPDPRAAISEQEAMAFAAQIHQAVFDSDRGRFLQLVDWRQIFDRATAVPNLPELQEQREHFTTRGLTEVSRTGAIHEGIHQAIKGGASYKPLHVDLNVEGLSILF